MAIFGGHKKKGNQWEQVEVYVANPHFYSDEKGNIFGAFALSEDVLTGLLLNPKDVFLCDGKKVDVWRLMLVSTTKDSCLGDMDYFTALDKLKKYSIGEKDGYMIVKPLKLEEQLDVLGSF